MTGKTYEGRLGGGVDRRQTAFADPKSVLQSGHRLNVQIRTDYSITRSARRRIDCGIVTPITFAVLRLMCSS